MKKIISLILVIMLLLCGCSAPKQQTAQTAATTEDATLPEEAPALQAGFSKICITPADPQPLGGYSDNATRISTDVLMDLYATCIAVTSGDETILLFTLDTLNVDHQDAQEYRYAITSATDIPGEKIFIGATHAHNCPGDSGAYKILLKSWMAEAAEEALADRAPATLHAATPTIDGMNFVRHYKMSDGTYAGSNFGSFQNAKIEGHAAEADNQAVLVKFDREDKQDILMINWQAHPDMASKIGYTSIAPSWVGPLRDQVENQTGMCVAYFTGPSGNLVPDSRMPEYKHGLTWQQYGQEMGKRLSDAANDLQPVESEGIRLRSAMVTVDVDHSWDSMCTEADKVFSTWKTKGLEEGNRQAKEYGFSSVYQARAIRSRFQMSQTDSLELNVFSIGGIGFTTSTYEMFTESAKFVKENSPFQVTFMITGNSGYIPVEAAYEYRSYEADTGYFAKGTAEALAGKYVEMLKEIG